MSEHRSDEPSMEEILASIRRIISEDAAGPLPAPVEPRAEERKDEVLELMDEVQDDGSVKRVANDRPAAATEASGLISPTATAHSTRALAELASAVAREEVSKGVDIPLRNAERSLSDVVTELLRPLLREWLDQNLPGLIERLVRAEIEKLVRRAEGR